MEKVKNKKRSKKGINVRTKEEKRQMRREKDKERNKKIKKENKQGNKEKINAILSCVTTRLIILNQNTPHLIQQWPVVLPNTISVFIKEEFQPYQRMRG